MVIIMLAPYHVDSQGMDQPCHVSKGLKPEEFRKYRLYRRSVCANVCQSLQAVHTSGADDLQLASRERRRHAVTCKQDSTTDSASYTACWAGSTTWNASLCLCAEHKAGKKKCRVKQLLLTGQVTGKMSKKLASRVVPK